MNEIRSNIIKKIMHQPGLHFNELWDRNISSNKFAYHLKVLEEDGIIEKKDDGYYLTYKGKKYVVSIDGKSGKYIKAPLTCVALVVIKDNKILMSQRKKEPFYNIWELPSGKIEFDKYILEAAKEELKEETGLDADLSIKGLFCSKTYNNKEQSYNHFIFIIKGENPQGCLINKTREGKNKWIDINQINSLEMFPDIPKLIEIVLQDRFTLLEMDRHQDNDEFKEISNIKEIKF